MAITVGMLSESTPFIGNVMKVYNVETSIIHLGMRHRIRNMFISGCNAVLLTALDFYETSLMIHWKTAQIHYARQRQRNPACK